MNNVKKKSILWDNDAEQEATNYDGTDPVIDGDYVYMKELGCNCNPANGAGCGGCVEQTEEHKIGTRFVWRKAELPSREEIQQGIRNVLDKYLKV